MRSDNVTKGAERAPNRSLFYALGYTPEDLEKPLIAVVSAHSDIVPGHMNLDKLTEREDAAIRWQACFEYWADTLEHGTPEEQAQIYRERGAIAKWIEKVLSD